MGQKERLVLVAGGGPVGLLCAWLLGRRGLPVRLFDDNDGPQADPRAATTHPATLDLLTGDGLDVDMARVGLVAPIFQFWDRPSDTLVAEFDHAATSRFKLLDEHHVGRLTLEQLEARRTLMLGARFEEQANHPRPPEGEQAPPEGGE